MENQFLCCWVKIKYGVVIGPLQMLQYTVSYMYCVFMLCFVMQCFLFVFFKGIKCHRIFYISTILSVLFFNLMTHFIVPQTGWLIIFIFFGCIKLLTAPCAHKRQQNSLIKAVCCDIFQRARRSNHNGTLRLDSQTTVIQRWDTPISLSRTLFLVHISKC